MNKNMAIAWIIALILIGSILFFVLDGFRPLARMLAGPRGNFGEFGDGNSYYARIGESLGLPEEATKEQVLETLGLPEDASQEQIREALQEKGIIPMRRN